MCSALASVPMSLTPESLAALLNLVECLYIYAGHPENRFVEMITARKGVLKTKDGQTASFLDDYASVSLNGEIFKCNCFYKSPVGFQKHFAHCLSPTIVPIELYKHALEL